MPRKPEDLTRSQLTTRIDRLHAYLLKPTFDRERIENPIDQLSDLYAELDARKTRKPRESMFDLIGTVADELFPGHLEA